MADKELKNQLDGLFSDLEELVEPAGSLTPEPPAAPDAVAPAGAPPEPAYAWPAAFKTVAAISELTATIFEPDELLQQVVARVQTNFNLHSVSVYLLSDRENDGHLAWVAGVGGPPGNDDDRIAPDDDQSLVALAVKNKRVEVNNTLPRSPDSDLELPQARAELAAPMIIVDMVIGALHVAAARPNHFEAGAATVFATLAGQLVVALQNIRLLKDTEDQAQRLAMLNKMGVALNLTLTLAETFKVAARHITRIVQGSYTSIALLTGSGDRLELYTPDGEDDSTLISADIPLRGTAIGKVVRDNALLNIADLTASPFTDFESLAQQGLHAGLIVPLVVGKQVIGTITVARGPAKPYTPREENLLLHIASFLASTIDNKRLFQQTQTALIETEVLYEASADLNTAQSYNEVLATLRQYTMLGQSAQNVSLNYFDTPWAKDRQPEWVHALARWSELPLKEDRVRYRLASFAAAKLLRPDLPTLIEDLSAGPEFDPDMYLLFNRQEGAKSAIVLPLVAAGQWIGYVEAGFPHPTTFPEAEVRQMMALVSQAAVAVQSLRALELAEQQTRELAAVNKVLQAVSRELDMEQVLSTLYQEVQGIIPVQAFFVALYNDRANTISYPILYDEGRPLRKAPVPLPAKGNLHHVITTGEPVLVNYSPQDVEAIISGQKDAGNFEGRPAASVLYIPLRLGRQTIGAISVQSYQFDAYSRREVELLSSLANHVAVAIENARLYKQAQARARREQILRQVTARVRSSVEVDAVMRTTAHEVDRLLGRRAFVYLGNRPPTLAPANPTAKEADNGH